MTGSRRATIFKAADRNCGLVLSVQPFQRPGAGKSLRGVPIFYAAALSPQSPTYPPAISPLLALEPRHRFQHDRSRSRTPRARGVAPRRSSPRTKRCAASGRQNFAQVDFFRRLVVRNCDVLDMLRRVLGLRVLSRPASALRSSVRVAEPRNGRRVRLRRVARAARRQSLPGHPAPALASEWN